MPVNQMQLKNCAVNPVALLGIATYEGRELGMRVSPLGNYMFFI